jgi:sulfonate transport system ATP-binding protein
MTVYRSFTDPTLAGFEYLHTETLAEVEALPEIPQQREGLGLTLYGVSKFFGDTEVLRSINLDLRPGEFVAIVGRSGCGKSTLLRLIAGLDTPSAGLIGFGLEGRERRPNDVRVMFQEPRLLPWASVDENVAIGLGDGVAQEVRSEAARVALTAVGLADRGPEWPSVLSGGQKQRVALARALVSGPGILALDEPLGALDALTRIDMQALLEQVWQEKRFTALMVTHDVGEAVALADRVVLIEEGQIALDIQVDLPRPRQRGTAQFSVLERQLLDRLLERSSPTPLQKK